MQYVQDQPKCKEFMSKVGYLSVQDEVALTSDERKVFTEWQVNVLGKIKV